MPVVETGSISTADEVQTKEGVNEQYAGEQDKKDEDDVYGS